MHHGDCLDVLREMPDESVHAVITDPPYGLASHGPQAVIDALATWANPDGRDKVPGGRGFMGREWDAFVPPPAVWDECLRVLKPGGHLAVFAGSRTVDLMGLSIRLAGFELRDSLAAWLYGNGMPKSLDVGKAIDRIGGVHPNWQPLAYAAAVQRSGGTHADVDRHLGLKASSCYWARTDHRAATPLFRHWVAARDFLGLDDDFAAVGQAAEREVIGERTSGRGTGRGHTIIMGDSDNRDITAPATDAARAWNGWGTGLKPAHEPILLARKPLKGTVAANVLAHRAGAINVDAVRNGERWPTNVVVAHHPNCAPEDGPGDCAPECHVVALDEQADASRFLPTFRYCAKAPTRERPQVEGRGHPTVKPLALMQWLTRLLTPADGVVLDPFAGSGSTLQAAHREGFRAVGIEADEHSVRLIEARFADGEPHDLELPLTLFDGEAS